MPRDPIIIGNTKVFPGERNTIDLPVAQFYSHADMTMPVHVIHGKKEGPTLFVSAAIHGDEIQGVEIIRRLIHQKTVQKLRGTLITIPIVNVYGFINHSRYLPDRRDLNRSFPGSEKGSMTARLANLFMKEIVSHCTHGIDLHAASNHRFNLPQIRASIKDPETLRLAKAFGAPVILDTKLIKGTMRHAINKRGIPVLLYEAGEVLRFDEGSINAGIQGILSVMREIGMLPAIKSKKKKIKSHIALSSTWIRSPRSGVLHHSKALGSQVNKGDILGIVSDPIGNEEAAARATTSGIIIAKLNIPLVNEGDALFHIACFDKAGNVAEVVEDFKGEFDVEDE